MARIVSGAQWSGVDVSRATLQWWSICACLPAVQDAIAFRMAYALIRKNQNRVPLAETELASQPNRQHDKIAAKPKAPSQIEGFVEQHNYKCFFKASNAPVDPRQVEKVTVTVKLHADHSAADGNRAVTSEVNRPAISPIMTVAAARRPQLEK